MTALRLLQQTSTLSKYRYEKKGACHDHNMAPGEATFRTSDHSDCVPGEGFGWVSVHPDSGAYYAVTGNSGGYAIPIPTGIYTVTFSGGALADSESAVVSVNGKSALLDLVVPPVSTVSNRSSLPWQLLLLRHH
jgi:hypothetical protein